MNKQSVAHKIYSWDFKMALSSLEANFSLGLTYFEINFIRDHLNSKIFCTVCIIQPDLRNVCIYVCWGWRAMVLVWKSGNNLKELVLNPPCGLQGSTSGCQAQRQGPPPPEPSHWLGIICSSSLCFQSSWPFSENSNIL